MPGVIRSRDFASSPEELWAVVGDPHHLPRWWPRVSRIEAADADGFTQVLQTKSGRLVRADYRVVESVAPRRVRWHQQLEGSPFERVLQSAVLEIRIERRGDLTMVTLELRQRLRGMARFGRVMVSRAARTLLDDALEGLARIRD